jgi:hypothetical protein
VRTRHSDLVGDFGRSQRQQQVLSQLKTKLDTPSIISELPQLAQDMDGYVKTDMDLQTLVSLMNYARSLDPNKVDHLVLSPPYSTSYNAPDGESAFLPVCNLIVPQIARMFSLGSNATCNVTANSGTGATLAKTPQPTSATTVSIANGTGNPFQNLAAVSTMSLNSASSDVFDMHTILDLMLFIVLEAPDATKV